MKFLKECDCCQKELGTTMPCSVLVPFKAVALRALLRLLLGWWAWTSQKVNFAYCTDHRPVQGSHIESVINQLCFMKPSALIYVWLFSFYPAVNKLRSELSLPSLSSYNKSTDSMRPSRQDPPLKTTTSRQWSQCWLVVTEEEQP